MTGSDWYPDFFVIGAAKAATTWIQVQLQAHPAIFMPDPEPHFFSREYDRGLDHYAGFFEGRPQERPVIGEKSADYLSHPDAPARIAAMVPHARLVLQLRDPVERAYSDYKMFYRRGTVGGRPQDYLQSLDNPFPRFLEDGLYGRHVERWLRHFPREQILAFRFEDVAEAPEAVMRRTCDHLGVAFHHDAGLARRRENDSEARLLPLPLRKALAPLKHSVGPIRGNPAFEAARSLFARKPSYPPLTEQLRGHLRRFYRNDIERAEQLLQIDLSSWKQSACDVAA
jgi:hypothetical protein